MSGRGVGDGADGIHNSTLNSPAGYVKDRLCRGAISLVRGRGNAVDLPSAQMRLLDGSEQKLSKAGSAFSFL